MATITIVSGSFGGTSFAHSPVIVKVSGLAWPSNPASPFTIVRIEVKYGGRSVGDFRADTGGQTEIRFDISSALQAIWSDYTFCYEVQAASAHGSLERRYRGFSIDIYSEYIANGRHVVTQSGTFSGGQCAIGGMTELERSIVGNGDASVLQFSNPRFGDASTKPLSSLERVGSTSITSWVDLGGNGTVSHFYSPDAAMGSDANTDHAPLVLRDSQPYVDFLFVNRRGAVETCSAQTKEALSIPVETETYAIVRASTFAPDRSLSAIATGGRRSWAMSSGSQTREWATWWAMEFLLARRWWMRYAVGSSATYVPVIVKPAKSDVPIYDKARQQMPHVDFSVILALEG